MSSFLYDSHEAVNGSSYTGTATVDEESRLAEAVKEVDDFLQEFPPQGDYLDNLPEIPTPRCQYFREYERNLHGTDGKAIDRAGNLATVSVEVPPPVSDDVGEELCIWERSLNQIKIKLEYLSRQSDNLDIMTSHGQALYDQFTSYYENLKSELNQLANDSQNILWKGEENQQFVLDGITVLQKETQRLADKSIITGATKDMQPALVER